MIECEYKVKEKCLKEQFINSIYKDMMTTKSIKELTTMKKINNVTSEQVLMWAKRVKAK